MDVTMLNNEMRELTAAKPEIRALTADELDMVSGGTLIEFMQFMTIMACLLA